MRQLGCWQVFAAGRIELAVGDEFAVAPAEGHEQQFVLILLEHNGAVRRRNEVVCVGGSGSATASAPRGLDQRDGRLDAQRWPCTFRASRAESEQSVVSAG